MRSTHKQKNPTISNVKSLDLWSSRAGQIRTCRGKAPPSCLLALRTVKLPFQSSRVIFLGRNTSQKSSIISVKSVWKRCPMDLPDSSNPIRRKASRTSQLRPIIMWTRRFFKLPLQHGKIYGIAVPRFASWYSPSIQKAI